MILNWSCFLFSDLAMLWVFFFELYPLVTGEHLMTRRIQPSVLGTMKLNCHQVASNSLLGLAVVCASQDFCLGIKTNKQWGASRILCSCPNGPTWPGPDDVVQGTTTYLRIREDITLPGREFMLKFALYQRLREFAPKFMILIYHINKVKCNHGSGCADVCHKYIWLEAALQICRVCITKMQFCVQLYSMRKSQENVHGLNSEMAIRTDQWARKTFFTYVHRFTWKKIQIASMVWMWSPLSFFQQFRWYPWQWVRPLETFWREL